MFEYWVLRILNGVIVPDFGESLLQKVGLREILGKSGEEWLLG
jgi:hypothetical protein